MSCRVRNTLRLWFEIDQQNSSFGCVDLTSGTEATIRNLYCQETNVMSVGFSLAQPSITVNSTFIEIILKERRLY